MSYCKSIPRAFPVTGGEGGMSLRDWFAGMALQGMLNHSTEEAHPSTLNNAGTTIGEGYADSAYVFADAMLKVRDAQ